MGTRQHRLLRQHRIRGRRHRDRRQRRHDDFDLAAGQSVDCTYTNVPQTGSLLIVKERKHAADGLGETHPHAGVGFTVTGGNLGAGSLTGSTDANGELCFGGLVISSLVGDYTVTETVPAGYVSADSAQDVASWSAPTVPTRRTGHGELPQHAADRRHGFRELAGGRRHVARASTAAFLDDDPDLPLDEVVVTAR